MPKRPLSLSPCLLISVVARLNDHLPAPFSPSRAWTSPGRTSNDTPESALTPGKCFLDLAHLEERSGAVRDVGRDRGGRLGRGAHAASVARVLGSTTSAAAPRSEIRGKPCAVSRAQGISTHRLLRMGLAVPPLIGCCRFDCHTTNGLSNKRDQARSLRLERSRKNVDALRPFAYGSTPVARY